ncbi:MAG: hypothetical protein R3282_04105, partial [Rhodothermales bacterium]|nr:hypothetical protein [Rhodothermales bacterium]
MIDGDGSLLACGQFADSSRFNSVADVHEHNGSIVAAVVSGSETWRGRVRVVSVSNDLTLLSSQTLDIANVQFADIEPLANGFFLAGQAPPGNGTVGSPVGFLARFDSAGDRQWRADFGDASFGNVIATESGGAVFVLGSACAGGITRTVCLVEIDSAGDVATEIDLTPGIEY